MFLIRRRKRGGKNAVNYYIYHCNNSFILYRQKIKRS